MTADPLHRLIAERKTQIVDRFVSDSMVRQPPTRPLSREELVDHLNEYLDELSTALDANDARACETSPNAKRHGRQRWYEGYDLKSVVREYDTIRKAILQEVAVSDGALSPGEVDRLGEFLIAGIAEAAVEFTDKSNQQVQDALEHARRATQAREEVLAIVSHDLKNPLNVIYGALHGLLEDVAAGDLDAHRTRLQRRLEAVQRASHRMNQLITDMLDLARITAGEMQLKLESTSTGELLREACAQASTLAEQRGVRLLTQTATNGEAALRCDRDRVLEILQNLVGNAIKFSPVGGTVWLRASCGDSECRFEVTDNGPGIPPERLQLIFERYYRAPDVAAQGTGLGLSIAKGLVSLHGGRIWAESELGAGSSFVFTLPRELQRAP